MAVASFAAAAVVAHCSAGRLGGRPPVLSPRGFARVLLHANSTRLLDLRAEGVAKKCVCVCVCVCV